MYGDTGPCNGPFLPPTLPEAKGVYQGFQYNAFLKRHLPSCCGIAGFELIIVTDTTYSELNYFHQVVQYEKVRDNSFLDTTRSPRLVSVNPTVCCRNWLVTIQSHGVNDIIFCRDLLCHTAPSIEPRSGCHPSTWIFATPRKEWSQGCTCHGMYRSTLDAHNQVL